MRRKKLATIPFLHAQRSTGNSYFAKVAGPDNPYAVIAVAIIGIPYIRVGLEISGIALMKKDVSISDL
ncbi:MAG: hypothetical protein H6Q72_1086 [Firmicutes bacterium]|nr:hypothetical protein [Bacillota bacterium]